MTDDRPRWTCPECGDHVDELHAVDVLGGLPVCADCEWEAWAAYLDRSEQAPDCYPGADRW